MPKKGFFFFSAGLFGVKDLLIKFREGSKMIKRAVIFTYFGPLGIVATEKNGIISDSTSSEVNDGFPFGE